jgi:hypothetical protein
VQRDWQLKHADQALAGKILDKSGTSPPSMRSSMKEDHHDFSAVDPLYAAGAKD